MVKRGAPLPKKLTQDAIVEALLELRFEHKGVFEVFIGRLADHEYWKGWEQRTLPAYNIPAQFRVLDPQMQYVAIMELASAGKGAALRIGPSVASYHRIAPYNGWANFKPELDRVTESLFKAADSINIRRLGLRYMNALRPNTHFISSVGDLDLRLVISEDVISSAVNINFTSGVGRDTSCTVRIATKEFIQGALPQDTSVFVDVDVFTNEGFQASDKKVVNDWVEFAHTKEKDEFFHLFKQPTIDRLREE